MSALQPATAEPLTSHNTETSDDTLEDRYLDDDDKSRILALFDLDLPQAVIATQVGCHQSTVCRVIQRFARSTIPLARRRTDAVALDAVEAAIDVMRTSDKPEVRLKAASRLMDASGLGVQNQHVTVNQQVNIGLGASGELALPSVQIVSATPLLSVQDGTEETR